MKFFADFTPFSARYCDIADAAWKAEYGLWAIDSKQYLAENRLFRQSGRRLLSRLFFYGMGLCRKPPVFGSKTKDYP